MWCVNFTCPESWMKSVLHQSLMHQLASSINLCISQVLGQPEVGSSRMASTVMAHLCCMRSLVLQLTRPGLFIHLYWQGLETEQKHSTSLEAYSSKGTLPLPRFLLANASYKCSTGSKGREIVSISDGRTSTKSDLENVNHLWSHQRLGVSIRLSISQGIGPWVSIT